MEIRPKGRRKINKPRFAITSKQLIFIIIGSQIATAIFSLPRAASKDAGQDAWIAVILGAVIPLLSLFLIERMARRYPQLSFVGLSKTLFGWFLGTGLIILFVAYEIFFQSFVFRAFAELTSAYLLPNTPMPVIILVIALAVFYAASRGAQVVGRINEIFFFFLVLSLLMLIPSTFKEANYLYLLPVATTNPVSILKGALATQFAYGGMEVLLVFYSMVGNKNEVLKAGFIAVGITTCIYLFMTIICLLVYSSEVLQDILWPGLSILNVAYFPVIERLEFIFLTFWLSLGARPAINGCCAAADCLTRLLKLDTQKHYPLLVGLITLGIYILAILPKNIIQLNSMSIYATYTSLVIALGLPLLYLLVGALRREKVG